MATYVISDIHGEYGKFMELLDIIHFSDEDILYVLGDVVDRGKNPVKTLLKMMEMPNVIHIAGNHEQMMLECMSVLINEVKDENSIKEFAEKATGLTIFLCMEGLAISILRGILMIIYLMSLYGQGWIMMSDILMM